MTTESKTEDDKTKTCDNEFYDLRYPKELKVPKKALKKLKLKIISKSDHKIKYKKSDLIGAHFITKYYGGQKHNEIFDSSLDNDPKKFVVGFNQVIFAWDEALLNSPNSSQICLGDKIRIKIPSEYAYGYQLYNKTSDNDNDNDGNNVFTLDENQDIVTEMEIISINENTRQIKKLSENVTVFKKWMLSTDVNDDIDNNNSNECKRTKDDINRCENDSKQSSMIAETGDKICVDYIGRFFGGIKHDKVFDSNIERNKSFWFKLGEKGIIKGWNVGLIGACCNEKRILHISSHFGYGDKGCKGATPETTIDKNQDLAFQITILKIDKSSKKGK